MPGKGRQGNNGKLSSGERAGRLQKASYATALAVVARTRTPFERMRELLASREDNSDTHTICTVDASPEPLDVLLKTFRDHYADNAHDVDSLLFSATAWDDDADDAHLPPPGAVVLISSCSNLGLFRETQCQGTIRLAALKWP
ncbi:hypothetical protein PHYPSEUDO_011698 [Phytophthora pseudosyringae]|uniref:Uncharacterized protein n=1 Tax=Phytophthora pseudosyringae TaxID=221518 RepID=A0A8T1W9G4_9STRA|nr:hypothetical protein PHYPSEUDO_011698 [Phytophthora pseudosyringae]